MIFLLGLAAGFGMAVWLLFDWCWYPQPVSYRTATNESLPALRRLLLEAGVSDRVRPWPFVWTGVVLAMVGGIAVFQLFGIVVLGIAGAAGAGFLPVLLCLWLRATRRAHVQDAIGDVLAFLQSGIEQGRSVRESLGLLRDRGPVALRADFARLDRQMRVDFEDALLDLQARLANPIWDRCTAGILLGHRLGEESLGGVLARLATMNRDEQKIHRAIKAQQAQVHTAARIACAVPFLTVIGLRLLMPGAAAFYTSPVGELVVLGSVLVVGVGYWWMLRLGRVSGSERVAS